MSTLYDQKVVLLDGFAYGSEYWACTIERWNPNAPPSFKVRDWTAADSGFGPHDWPYYFARREGDVFYYSLTPPWLRGIAND